jgi:hypothetical protein
MHLHMYIFSFTNKCRYLLTRAFLCALAIIDSARDSFGRICHLVV